MIPNPDSKSTPSSGSPMSSSPPVSFVCACVENLHLRTQTFLTLCLTRLGIDQHPYVARARRVLSKLFWCRALSVLSSLGHLLSLFVRFVCVIVLLLIALLALDRLGAAPVHLPVELFWWPKSIVLGG